MKLILLSIAVIWAGCSFAHALEPVTCSGKNFFGESFSVDLTPQLNGKWKLSARASNGEKAEGQATEISNNSNGEFNVTAGDLTLYFNGIHSLLSWSRAAIFASQYDTSQAACTPLQ